MADSLGKKFEAKFEEDFLKLEESDVFRLHDQMSGYKIVSKNPSDFICYCYPYHFYIECKTIKGNTFPISGLSQYDKLLEKAGKKGQRAGVVIWFYEHGKIVYVPVKTFERLKNEGKKSVNIKMLDEKLYNMIEIPSKKRITFFDSDYSILMNLEEGW